jgi:hypothetical protein
MIFHQPLFSGRIVFEYDNFNTERDTINGKRSREHDEARRCVVNKKQP